MRLLKEIYDFFRLEFLKALKPHHPVLYYFSNCFMWFFFAGVILTLVFFFVSLYQVRGVGFCLKPGCLNSFLMFHEEAIMLASWSLSFLVSFSTIGAIIVALLSYINSVSSTALGTHIAHYKVFQEYLSFELEKNSKLSLSSINALQWYNLIFSKSRLGSTTVSEEYKKKVESINKLIAESNSKADSAHNGSFSYKDHQGKMITALASFGVRIERAPRNDFQSVENDIFKLIDSINLEFCSLQGIQKSVDRKYL
ncbi:retron Ec48 family effector membrane protein [Arsukibacterium sp. MJ3]|uniref:retron Ec48 family effector membrane protein n=1 Tax=Arsukibacterium sp. MJ3 TaxID=1632859 RepID=UPI00069B2105|nr:retron Ec48 family effector membrane protein [Arsukibacterium sp. MJ3]